MSEFAVIQLLTGSQELWQLKVGGHKQKLKIQSTSKSLIKVLK